MNTRTRVLFTCLALLASLLAAFPAGPVLGQAAGNPTLVVTVATLNVRQGPGTNYRILGVLHRGDERPVAGRNAGSTWYQLAAAGGSPAAGWVSASYVRLNGDVATVPVIAAPAATAAAGPSAGTARTGAAAGGLIVFQASSGGAIYVLNADGSGLRRLTTGIDPALSPDGRQVAFTRWDGVQNGVTGSLWVINVDGSGERKVLGGINQPKSPSWSQDGKQAVLNIQQGGTVDPRKRCPNFFGHDFCFTLPADPYWALTVVDMATGSFEDQPHDQHSFGPTWDPVNPWRVVSQGARGLVAVDLNQRQTSQLTTDPGDRAPVFSPDGSKIAVSFWQHDHWEIHLLNANGSGAVRLTETPSTVLAQQQLAGQSPRSWQNAAPAWSPDGSRIAFLTDRTGSWQIWVMNADGTGQRPLFPNGLPGGISIDYQGMSERVISWR